MGLGETGGADGAENGAHTPAMARTAQASRQKQPAVAGTTGTVTAAEEIAAVPLQQEQEVGATHAWLRAAEQVGYKPMEFLLPDNRTGVAFVPNDTQETTLSQCKLSAVPQQQQQQKKKKKKAAEGCNILQRIANAMIELSKQPQLPLTPQTAGMLTMGTSTSSGGANSTAAPTTGAGGDTPTVDDDTGGGGGGGGEDDEEEDGEDLARDGDSLTHNSGTNRLINPERPSGLDPGGMPPSTAAQLAINANHLNATNAHPGGNAAARQKSAIRFEARNDEAIDLMRLGQLSSEGRRPRAASLPKPTWLP